MNCTACGHAPTYKEIEAAQAPYRGMWQAIVAWEAEQNPDGNPSTLRDALHRIASEHPEPAAIVAVRTTEYGGNPRHG